jgi:predicted adenine nucleotide alpha hydrolase (AANH) superfamily ATPase
MIESRSSATGKRLLLHACCGPCSIVPFDQLSSEGWSIAICYLNPNIAPQAEYARRLETLRGWAALHGAPVIEGPCDRDAWEREVAPFGANRKARCAACYRLRLRQAADIAVSQGFDAMATTLAVSPYQLLDVCNRQLESVCAKAGIEAVPRDYRSLYPVSVSESRRLGMYRQNYCGCRFSAAEAALDRANLRDKRYRERVSQRAVTAARALQGSCPPCSPGSFDRLGSLG